LWMGFQGLFFLGVIGVGRAQTGPDKFPSIAVSVDGSPFHDPGNTLEIPANARKVIFQINNEKYGKIKHDPNVMRYAYQWTGVDEQQKVRDAVMGLVVRFYDDADKLIDRAEFLALNESPGWKGAFEQSEVIRRKEQVTVPQGTSKLGLLVTSAGPPEGIGAYAAGDVLIYREGKSPELVYDFDSAMEKSGGGIGSFGWVRDGTNPPMAELVTKTGGRFKAPALAIIDYDPGAHAEWRLGSDHLIPVSPGENLTLEWSEMYSVGMAGQTAPSYICPPVGDYQFQVKTFNAMGIPVAQRSIRIVVYPPYWMRPWFWGLLVLCFVAITVFFSRMVIRKRVEKHIAKIEQANAIERERLRIARNIHDDLGARLTHISLISSGADNGEQTTEQFKHLLGKVSVMTRDLVSSLYETVWTVDPQNDSVPHLFHYLAQISESLCQAAGIRCHVSVPPVISPRFVSSGLRHSVSLVMKEALHNAVKHSGAKEIRARFSEEGSVLSFELSDDGHGFDVNASQSGFGLGSMAGRAREVGGDLKITSSPLGTKIELKVQIA